MRIDFDLDGNYNYKFALQNHILIPEKCQLTFELFVPIGQKVVNTQSNNNAYGGSPQEQVFIGPSGQHFKLVPVENEHLQEINNQVAIHELQHGQGQREFEGAAAERKFHDGQSFDNMSDYRLMESESSLIENEMQFGSYGSQFDHEKKNIDDRKLLFENGNRKQMNKKQKHAHVEASRHVQQERIEGHVDDTNNN